MNNELFKTIERTKGIPASYTFVADNTLRAIDLIFRTFCQKGDRVLGIEPNRRDYHYVAEVNNIDYKAVPLDNNLSLTASELLRHSNAKTRLIWLSLPNIATGTTLQRQELMLLMEQFQGMVVVDESLSDYSRQRPLRYELPKHPNLIVLNEPGMIFCSPQIKEHFERLSPLYATLKTTILPATDLYDQDRLVTLTLQERDRMMEAFSTLPICSRVYASDANFFVVQFKKATEVSAFLANHGISLQPLDGRQDLYVVPVGKRSDNNMLVGALRQFGA